MSKILKVGLFLLMPLGLFSADSVILQQNAGEMIIENQFIRAVVDSQGGKLKHFITLNGSKEYVADATVSGKNSGFNKFKFMNKSTVHDLNSALFRLTAVVNTPERAVISAEYIADSGAAKGLKFVNRYELAAGENRLKCESLIVAQADFNRELAPWIAHSVKLPQASDDKKSTMIFAGSSRGIFCTPAYNAPLIQSTVTEPSSPWWLAMASNSREDGILLLGSSKQLDKLYFWIGSEYFFTAEPIFRSQLFADDTRWSESVWQIPLNGLSAVHFATPEFAGALETDGIRVMPTISAKNVTVEYALKGGQKGKKVFSNWTPGKTELIAFKPPQNFQLLQLTVVINGKKIKLASRVNADRTASQIVAQKGLEASAASGKIIMTHAKDILYLTDCNLAIHFGLESTLPKTVKKCEMNLELPLTVTLCNSSASFHDKIIVRDGKKYRHYRFTLTPRSYYAALTLHMKTSLAPGESTEGYFYASASGVSQTPQKLQIVSTSIPQCSRRPKRLLAGLGFYGLRHIKKWPEIYDLMLRCGANTISLREDSNVEDMRKVVDRARELGMYVKVNEAPAGTGKFIRMDPEGRVSGIDGSRSDIICPSYRGAAFEAEKKQLTDYALAGASIVFWDTETWNRREFCFCDRCIKLFEQFFRKNAPDKSWKSPKEFELNPGANADYHELWKRFKVELGAEYFGEFVREYRRKLAASGNERNMTPPGVPPLFGLYGVWPGRGIYHQFMRYEEFAAANVLNIAMPCYYVGGDAAEAGRGVRKVRAAMGNSRIVPFITGGASAEYETDAVTLKHIMLEIFLNGAMGFAVWPYLGWDAEDLKALSETMNLVRPLEDIIVDGKIMTGLQVNNNTATVVGMELDNRGAILISDYSRASLPELVLTVAVKKAAGLYDVGSVEKLADLTPGVNKVKLKKYGDKVRLLSFGANAPDVDFKVIPSMFGSTDPTPDSKLPAALKKPLVISETAQSIKIANDFYSIDISRSNGVISRIAWGDGKRVTRHNYFNTSGILIKNDYMLGTLEKGCGSVKLVKQDPFTAVVTINNDVASTNRDNVKPLNAQIEYTFSADTPLVHAQFQVSTEGRFSNCRINDFSFVKEKWTKLVSGPVCKLEVMPETIRNQTFKTKSRAKGYSYIGVADDDNHAFVMSSAGHEPPAFVHVNKFDHLFIRGFYRGINSETVKFSQQLYIGPADQIDRWVRK